MILHSDREGNDCIQKLWYHCIQILHLDIYSVYKANGHTSTMGNNPSLTDPFTPWTSKFGKNWRFWKMADSKKKRFSKSPILNINWNYIKIDKWDFLEANYNNWPVLYPQYSWFYNFCTPSSYVFQCHLLA